VKIVWAPGAWQDYLYWARSDVRVHDKINTLIDDIQRRPFAGPGKPEPLKRNLRGFWSRRINREHRLVYRIEAGVLQIAQCRFHY
jgi:toxin YoeB